MTGTSRGRGCWRRTRAAVRGLGDGLLIVRTLGAGAEDLIPSATYKIDHMIHFPSVPPSFPSFPLLYVAWGMPYAGLHTLFLLVLLDTQYASKCLPPKQREILSRAGKGLVFASCSIDTPHSCQLLRAAGATDFFTAVD